MRSWLALWCCVALAACASSRATKVAPSAAPEATSGAPSPLPGDPHAQIEDLERKIDASRLELGLAEPVDLQGAPVTPMGAMPSSQDPKCRPAPSDTCKTSCTLSDSICGNADSICRIAQDLADDGWAQNKCAKANKTCEASRAKCCGCQ